MRRGILLVLLITAVALVAPNLASAQADDTTTQGSSSTTTTVTTSTSQSNGSNWGSGVGFGPVLGWTKANGSDAGKIEGGLALRMHLSPALGLEGSILYRQDKFNNGAVTATTWPVQVTGLVYVVPMVYGAIGAGWYHTTYDYDASVYPTGTNSETQTQFGWHFGGGVEVPLGRASFTADIRYTFLNYDFKQLPGTGGTNANFFTLNFGILFGL
jgi:hypothetical protein